MDDGVLTKIQENLNIENCIPRIGENNGFQSNSGSGKWPQIFSDLL